MKSIEFEKPVLAAAMNKKDIFYNSSEDEILAQFSEKEQQEIKYKQKLLSSLAYFIGKDFRIPVELNFPGAGWHWDFKANKIRIDPKDLLEKSEEYLKFVISHEGGHRRVSRTDFIPLEIWQQPGFSFMMNAIEDPRTNNFVAEAYPKFKEQMFSGYEWIKEMEKTLDRKAQEKLGYQPRFKQAGFEYIKSWFREMEEKTPEVSDNLPQEVKAVIEKTKNFSRNSYLIYPSREEADKGGSLPSGKKVNNEEMIKAFAQASYKINLNKIWPEFKKLVEKDLEDQKMQEFMKDMQKDKMSGEKQSGGESGLPQELKNKLTEEEQKELSEAIDEAIKKNQEKRKEEQDSKKDSENGEGKDGKSAKSESDEDQDGERDKNGRAIDPDSLSDELKQKIKEYMESLPEDRKKELGERAEKSIKEFEKEISEELEGKLTQNPEKKEAEKGERKIDEEEGDEKDRKDQEEMQKKQKEDAANREKIARQFREQAEKSLMGDKNEYEKQRRNVLPIIKKLENQLSSIFFKRRMTKWEAGNRTGRKININKRIQEISKSVAPSETSAWERKEAPQEKDYAITLLVDLSGSMDNRKIIEAFKSAIVFAEVLSRLNIRTEILGFNDRIYEYKKFNEPMSGNLRENMGGMLEEVKNRQGGRAAYNDDGWAVGQASLRLAKEKVQEKILIVLSDGQPEPSDAHKGPEFDLKNIVENISKNTKQKLIGLGILTDSVKNYYKRNLPNISAKKLGQEIAKTLKEAIENFG